MDNNEFVEKTAMEMVQQGAQVTPVMAPLFSSSAFRVITQPNECIIQFQRLRPMVVALGAEQAEGLQFEPVAIMSVSPQSLKDLSVLIAEGIALYESEWGVIETEFTRSKQRSEAVRAQKSK